MKILKYHNRSRMPNGKPRLLAWVYRILLFNKFPVIQTVLFFQFLNHQRADIAAVGGGRIDEETLAVIEPYEAEQARGRVQQDRFET